MLPFCGHVNEGYRKGSSEGLQLVLVKQQLGVSPWLGGGSLVVLCGLMEFRFCLLWGMRPPGFGFGLALAWSQRGPVCCGCWGGGQQDLDKRGASGVGWGMELSCLRQDDSKLQAEATVGVTASSYLLTKSLASW